MLPLKILALLFTISSFTLYAQNSLQGSISDSETKEALPGVIVYIPDLKKGVATNLDGKFLLEGLPKGKFLLEIKLVGYSSWVQPVQLEGPVELNIFLSSKATELNEVVVTGISHTTELKRNPIPIATINNQSLVENAASNIIDNISRKPGMSQITTGAAISKPVIRGLGYNRIITLYDGIRQEGQQWGDEHGIEVDEFSVDRVEIIKGAGSLMYGGDGLGGVIHFLGPKPADPGSVIGSWKSNYQTNNGLIGNSIMASGNHKGIYWLARASEKIAKGYTNAFDRRVFNSGFTEMDFNSMVGVHKRWGYSELAFSSFDQNVGLVEGDRDSNGKFKRLKNINGTEVETTVTTKELNSYSLFIPQQGINHIRVSNTSNIYFGESRIQVNLGYQKNQRKEFGNVLDKGSADLYFNLTTLNYSLIYFLPQLKDWEFSVGTSGMTQGNKNKGSKFIIPEYHTFDWGAFLFVKKPFGKLDVAGGVRYDQRVIDSESLYLDPSGNPTDDQSMMLKFSQAHVTFSNVSASAGFTYEFSNHFTGKLNASRGFRAPNISELSSNGKHEGTLRYEYGNYNLKSETSFQLDASVLLNSKHVSAELSAFQNTIDNYVYPKKLVGSNGLDSIPDPTDPSPAYQYVQGKAQLLGGEFSIDIHPHPLDWLHFENSFSFVYGLDKSQEKTDSSKYLPFIPASRILTELRANIKKIGDHFSNTFFKIEYEYSFKQNRVLLENRTETPTGAYSVWNLGMGTEIKSKKETTLFLFYVSINNLFDKAYQNNMSRLKYAAENQATGRVGVFNMGRNFSFKLVIPISFKKPL